MNSKPFKHLESLCAAEAKIRITTQPHKIPLFASSAFKFESIEDGIEIFKISQVLMYIPDMEIQPLKRLHKNC